MFKNKCEGCLTFVKKESRCLYYTNIKNPKLCPCRKCLLKMVCERMCDKFHDLAVPDMEWKANPRFVGRMMI